MFLKTLIFLAVLSSFSALAGKITIEQKDSLIRNEQFDSKRERAKKYLHREELRKLNNESWSYRLAPECVLLKYPAFIYHCGDGYYQGQQVQGGLRYRRLSEAEVKKLPVPAE